jgi:myo-inositol-1(or 4)-monophosphatase
VVARLLGEVRDIRRFGSAAVDLCWTAMGRYDAYYERGVKAWDVAAGTLVCEGIGLEVVELPARGVLPVGVLVAPAGLVPELLALVG